MHSTVIFVNMPRLSIFSLQIEEEEVFVEISGILSTARCWEERASSILASETQMYDLKDLARYITFVQACKYFYFSTCLVFLKSFIHLKMFVPRMSINIDAVLPSLKGIENTISLAETWLQNSEPFLSATSSMASSPCSLLELPVLKVCLPLVSGFFFFV